VFTGNKVEFRAVSPNQSIAFPNIALNVAVTESLDDMATELEKAVRGGRKLAAAVKTLLQKTLGENKRIIFNGNNYSSEWSREAARRGLLNLRDTVDALPELIKPEAVKAFEKYKVLNEREIHARHEVALETYNKTINIEGQLMVLMANRYILPAAFQYLKQVAESVVAVKAAGGTTREGKGLLKTLTSLTDELKKRTDRLTALLESTEHNGSAGRRARHLRDKVVPAMATLRETGDQLETIVPHDLWPLPSYREMLFIK
jgi:glutamine synthetase